MSLPDPAPGLVIRYAYLWEREARRGREEGSKDRPCSLLFFLGDGDQAYVAPITHTQPDDPEHAIEIPQPVNDMLGLDEARSWIVLTELNVFTWPGPDLRPIPGSDPVKFHDGFLPPTFFRSVRDKALALLRARKARGVSRSE
ncbi:MAG: growth inhibitor PemK [Pseudomonadota bacterium]